MTQEDKDLLLKYLCMALPYGVIVDYKENEFEFPHWKITTIYPETLDGWIGYEKRVGAGSESGSRPFKIGDTKPYLRPISSMTEEEMDKLFDILHIDKDGKDEDWIKINDDLGIKFFFPTGKWIENVADAYDYLCSIHIDFRGLISKCLALEAPKNMYNIK